MNTKLIKILVLTAMAAALVLMICDESWQPWTHLIIYPGAFALAILERRDAIRKNKESAEQRSTREIGLLMYGAITLVHAAFTIKVLLNR